MITSTATMAATMQADSHARWNRAVQMGDQDDDANPDVEPAASSSATTDPVQMIGASTGIQAGSRDRGTRKAAAVASSSTRLPPDARKDR